jgi:putative methyltransferase (TIGR04325 family)
VLSRVRHLLSREKQYPMYATYAEASAACGSAYEDDEQIADVVVLKTERFIEDLKNGPLPLDVALARTMLGLACVASGDGVVRVLDFGGAAGYHYFLARRLLPASTRLDWRVVETPYICARAGSLAPGELQFHPTIEEATATWGRPPSLVFASGVLQCLSDPPAVARQLVDVGADVMVITRTALTSDGMRGAIIQTSKLSYNGPGPMPPGIADRPLLFPTVLIPREELESILESRYTIVASGVEETCAYRARSQCIDMYGYVCIRP